VKLAKVVEINELLRIYGGLLTRRQSEVLTRRYGQDLSLGEIADEFGISRQGVLNFENKAINQLRKFEKHLGVLSKQVQIKKLLESVITDTNARTALAEMVM
jgi:predicted DNA-binding protein YlxM (UPF0122 family)